MGRWIYLGQLPKLDICVGNTEFVRIDVWGRQIFTPWVCCWPDPLTKCSNIWQPEMRFQINYLSPKSLCARFYSLLLINASTPEFEYRPGFIVINFKVLTLWSSIRPCLGLFSNCIEQIMPCLTTWGSRRKCFNSLSISGVNTELTRFYSWLRTVTVLCSWS